MNKISVQNLKSLLRATRLALKDEISNRSCMSFRFHLSYGAILQDSTPEVVLEWVDHLESIISKIPDDRNVDCPVLVEITDKEIREKVNTLLLNVGEKTKQFTSKIITIKKHLDEGNDHVR